MPLLGGLLVNLFGGFVAFIAQYLTRKVAFGVATVTAMSVLTVGLFVVFRGVLATLYAYSSGPALMFTNGLALAVPPASTVCISTYVTMWTACTVYTWQRDLIHLFAKS